MITLEHRNSIGTFNICARIAVIVCLTKVDDSDVLLELVLVFLATVSPVGRYRQNQAEHAWHKMAHAEAFPGL